MSRSSTYLDTAAHPVVAIVAGVDRDVERGEDILMLGYGLVLMAPIFAPIAPPRVLLPLMALAFVVSVCVARGNFLGIRDKLAAAMAALDGRHDASPLRPLTEIFAEHPKASLSEGFNPLKNWQRTAKSILGAMLINPLWMPIFYALGLQFAEEKQLSLLNRAVIEAEEKSARWR
ncbi:hypothetical protein NP590_02045 [Methylomonas sp. SURF-2]|uniref:ABC transmembrane type-1 domain-containing protein n=1 Tax=Methylomonas subterranea TaxID=2952225 RepID=A0ABT1TC74_9GAMM|nr:hypothetical protein [Methylomonas sp. SURF-2]MCQ8102873.1 hypothetical protein [Methylomonas sp. SURF-2]